MKQKTGKLTVLTVLLLTVCIAAGALLLPRLLGEAMTLPEGRAAAGNSHRESQYRCGKSPAAFGTGARESRKRGAAGPAYFCTGEPHRNAVLAGGG